MVFMFVSGFGFGLMVVDDFDLFGVRAGPDKANAPLVVDTDGMLAGTIALQGLEPVARREPQEGKFDGGIDELKFGEGPLLDIRRKTTGAGAVPEFFSLGAREALDHRGKLRSPGYPSSR